MIADPLVQDILKSIQIPRIPGFETVVEAASGEEIREKIMLAIEACSQHGGGRVVIPPGSFRCRGPIHLKSRIELHFSEGTFLKFSPDPELYLPPVPTRWEGVEIINYSPFIYGNGISDVAITGKGVIAGGSEIFQSWRPLQKEAQDRSRCLEERHIPPEQRVFGPGDNLRPARHKAVSFDFPQRPCRNRIRFSQGEKQSMILSGNGDSGSQLGQKTDQLFCGITDTDSGLFRNRAGQLF